MQHQRSAIDVAGRSGARFSGVPFLPLRVARRPGRRPIDSSARVWIRHGYVLLAIIVALGGTRAIAQCAEQQKITASDATAGSRFGAGMAVDGDTVVVGAAWEACTAGTFCGSAYVFRFNGSMWVEQQKLTASDAAQNDFFGDSVSVDGSTIVVGSFLDDCAAGGPDCGSAYVYRFNGSSWVEEQKLSASDAAPVTRFGAHVSISGDTIVVGAVWTDGVVPQTGAAYIFRFNGSSWVEEQKLTASDGASGDEFSHVSLSGDTAVVGAHGHGCTAGSRCGAAYVFQFNGSIWVEQQKLTASDAAASDLFGQAVSIDGDTVVVGAPRDDDAGSDSGSAYVFARSGGVWTQQQKLTASDAAAADRFGGGVAVDGDTTVVGASQDDDAGSDSGSAYVFLRTTATWTEQPKLTASDATAGDAFGGRVAVAGGTAMVGATDNDDAGSNSGSAYVFRCSPTEPIPAVSEWGLIVMSLLVLTAGTLVYTRRRPTNA